MNKSYAIVPAILFGLAALPHMIRALMGQDVVVGDSFPAGPDDFTKS